jgi:polyphosphate glucokinase
MADTTSPIAVGIDVGGSGIKGAPVDRGAGELVTARTRLKTPSPATPDRVASVVVQLLERLDVDATLGITLPAVVRRGVVQTAANIDEAWIGVDAVELFGTATGRPVTVVNDADAAGIAEVRFGAGKGRDGVVVMMTLGTGIGSAVFTDGALVPNTELGHLPLHERDAEDWAAASVRESEDLSWEVWATRLEEYLCLVERLLWPELIILGGGVSKHAAEFVHHLDLRTDVVPAELHNDAGIVGAALLAPTDGSRADGSS